MEIIQHHHSGLKLHTKTKVVQVQTQQAREVNGPIILVIWGMVMALAAILLGAGWVVWEVLKVAAAFFGRLW